MNRKRARRELRIDTPSETINSEIDDQPREQETLSRKAKLLKEKAEKVTREPTKTADTGSMQIRHLRPFFDQPCEHLARNLLGKKLIRMLNDGTKLAGVIVETEAYLGEEDKASHSYQNRKTQKNEAMFMPPGTIYVYNIYGIYTCMNISARGSGAAVLLRAIDPVEGEDAMRKVRGLRRADKGQSLKVKELCSGPSKLTTAFQIDKNRFNKSDITDDQVIWLEDGINVPDSNIVITSRIGISYAEEWTKKPLRFYIKGNQSVSIRDKVAEAKQNE